MLRKRFHFEGRVCVLIWSTVFARVTKKRPYNNFGDCYLDIKSISPLNHVSPPHTNICHAILLLLLLLVSAHKKGEIAINLRNNCINSVVGFVYLALHWTSYCVLFSLSFFQFIFFFSSVDN